MEFIFTVTVSKGSGGGPAWSQYRSDNASCSVSMSVQDTPLVSIGPKVCWILWGCHMNQVASFADLNISQYDRHEVQYEGLARIQGSENASNSSVSGFSSAGFVPVWCDMLRTFLLTGDTAKIQPFVETGALRVCGRVGGGSVQQSHRGGVCFRVGTGTLFKMAVTASLITRVLPQYRNQRFRLQLLSSWRIAMFTTVCMQALFLESSTPAQSARGCAC